MVEADYRLLTEGLDVNHARLVMGTSMGGMHTWLWGELHPDFTDALMPLASLPTQISGRNRLTYAERRRLDLSFVRNRSLRLYLRILLRTVPEVWSGSNSW